MGKMVYLDYASTTPLDSIVFKEMRGFFSKNFGNPANLYSLGRKAKSAILKAKKTIAKYLNCQPEEIIFTSSGTESDNLAIFGIARAYKNFGNHIITTNIEHHAILEPVRQLEKEGFQATFLEVDQDGILPLDSLEKAISDQTILISVIYANNEIGTIQQIKEIGKIVKKIKKERERRGIKTPIFFHSDACQAAGYFSLNVKNLGLDLMSLNGSKIYGPKGIGALFVKNGIKLNPLIFGGGQQKGLRSGTENVPGIVGLAKALEIAQKKRRKENLRQEKLRDYFIQGILQKIPRVILNGHPKKRLPNNINITICDIEGEAALLWLDKYGIFASTGSACDSQSLEPSHVIMALGRPYEFAHGSLRFTLGRYTTKEEIDYVLEILPKVVEKLRKISPVRVDFKAKELSLPRAFLAGNIPHFLRKKNNQNHR